MAYFPRAISSFGAGIQLSASIRHIERAAPANNRPYRVCCSTTMLPFMIRAAIQAARITKNRSRGITSLPVLGAAAAQDEARGREAYFNGRSAPDESIGSSAANGHFIGPAALSALPAFAVHPFPWLPASDFSPCPWRSSPVSSLPSAHDAPGENSLRLLFDALVDGYSLLLAHRRVAKAQCQRAPISQALQEVSAPRKLKRIRHPAKLPGLLENIFRQILS